MSNGISTLVLVISITFVIVLIVTVLLISVGQWDALYQTSCLKLLNVCGVSCNQLGNCAVSWDDPRLEVSNYTLHEICQNKFGANVQETNCKNGCSVC